MSVRLLRVRHIGRPVIVVAIPRLEIADWFGEVGAWLALCRRAFTVTKVSSIPPYLRDDLGLPPDPFAPRHLPLDPTIVHRWHRW